MFDSKSTTGWLFGNGLATVSGSAIEIGRGSETASAFAMSIATDLGCVFECLTMSG